ARRAKSAGCAVVFGRKPAPERVKKIIPPFERPAGWRDLFSVGAVIPPHQLYSARAPIHPKRPYGFDPSGCPPGRVFYFWRRFSISLRARWPVFAATPPCRRVIGRRLLQES